jgi:hypothetical protein
MSSSAVVLGGSDTSASELDRWIPGQVLLLEQYVHEQPSSRLQCTILGRLLVFLGPQQECPVWAQRNV